MRATPVLVLTSLYNMTRINVIMVERWVNVINFVEPLSSSNYQVYWFLKNNANNKQKLFGIFPSIQLLFFSVLITNQIND